MPLWLDLLRTPMAAPETSILRRMRRIWQGLCLTLAASVMALGPLTDVLGRVAPCLAAALLAATLVWTPLYLLRKQRADAAWLARDGEEC